jgi:hypothetical protein
MSNGFTLEVLFNIPNVITNSYNNIIFVAKPLPNSPAIVNDSLLVGYDNLGRTYLGVFGNTNYPLASYVAYTNNSTIATNTWYHLVTTGTYSSSSGWTFKTYVNGVSMPYFTAGTLTGTLASNLSAVLTQTSSTKCIGIGDFIMQGTNFKFAGANFYTKCLTSEQVTANYNVWKKSGSNQYNLP